MALTFLPKERRKLITINKDLNILNRLIFLTHLCTEMEIAEEDGRFGASDDQDDEDQKEESVHVVNLCRPGSKTNIE